MAADTWDLQCMDDVSVAEEMGTGLGLELAREMLFLDVTIESDALSSISTLQRKKIPNSYLGLVLPDCISMEVHFDKIVYSHISILGNKAAHYLAKFALTQPNHVWIEEIPPIIGHCIIENLSP